MYLRALRNKNPWEQARDGHLSSNCLSCVATQGANNALSLWQVESGEDSRADRELVVYLIRKRGCLNDFHYATFGRATLESCGLTAAPETNEGAPQALTDRHYNVNVGTADRLLDFARALARDADLDVVDKGECGQFLADELRASRLQLTELQDQLRASLIKRYPDLARLADGRAIAPNASAQAIARLIRSGLLSRADLKPDVRDALERLFPDLR